MPTLDKVATSIDNSRFPYLGPVDKVIDPQTDGCDVQEARAAVCSFIISGPGAP